jgi:hypothetical protein
LPAFSLTIVSAALLLSFVRKPSVVPITTVVRLPPPRLNRMLIRTKAPTTAMRTTATTTNDRVSEVCIGITRIGEPRPSRKVGVLAHNVQTPRNAAHNAVSLLGTKERGVERALYV